MSDVMPHSTVLKAPSGEYVVVAEGSPVPDWYDLESGTTVTEGSEPQGPKPPAKSGPNAGAAKWADYAHAVGVEVPDGAKQGEIIALLEAAGKPTE